MIKMHHTHARKCYNEAHCCACLMYTNKSRFQKRSGGRYVLYAVLYLNNKTCATLRHPSQACWALNQALMEQAPQGSISISSIFQTIRSQSWSPILVPGPLLGTNQPCGEAVSQTGLVQKLPGFCDRLCLRTSWLPQEDNEPIDHCCVSINIFFLIMSQFII